MPALHIEDLPEKEKLKMEVEQLRKEVKLQRQQVSGLTPETSLSEMSQGQLLLACAGTQVAWFSFCSLKEGLGSVCSC
jgi:hypothetical protein